MARVARPPCELRPCVLGQGVSSLGSAAVPWPWVLSSPCPGDSNVLSGGPEVQATLE